MFRGFVKPLKCLIIVLLYAYAKVIAISYTVLRRGMSFLRCLAPPFDGHINVLLYAPAEVIAITFVILSFRIFIIGSTINLVYLFNNATAF